MLSTAAGIAALARLPQPENASSPMLDKLDGSDMLDKLLHTLNV